MNYNTGYEPKMFGPRVKGNTVTYGITRDGTFFMTRVTDGFPSIVPAPANTARVLNVVPATDFTPNLYSWMEDDDNE